MNIGIIHLYGFLTVGDDSQDSLVGMDSVRRIKIVIGAFGDLRSTACSLSSISAHRRQQIGSRQPAVLSRVGSTGHDEDIARFKRVR